MVEKQQIFWEQYGSCLRLSNGSIEAIVSVDVGPRVLFFGFVGGENIMNANRKEFPSVANAAMDSHYYPGAVWENLGGHRLWFSPEKMPDTYYPDTNPVAYTLTTHGVILTPLPQHENGLAMEIELIMDEKAPTMEVLHRITNLADEPKDLALWALSVCEKGGLVILPMNDRDTGLLSNRHIAVWPYTDLGDPRLYFGNRYVTLQQDPSVNKPLKLGFDLEKGKLWYVLKNSVFEKSYTPNHPHGRYPDGGVSAEIYTCPFFTEVESLSEQAVLASGATASHTERWTMRRKPCEVEAKNENSVAAFVAQLS